MARAVALLSGGLDSAVAVGCFLRQGGEVCRCLTFVYGQRSAAREVAAARALAARWDLPWQQVDLPWLEELARQAGSALVAEERDLPEGTAEEPGDAASAAAVWVPARNAVLLAAAAAWAEACGASTVLAGFNAEEAATFSDNSAAFVAAANEFLGLGTGNRVTVVAPTLAWDKPRIAAAARDLGLGPAELWSCYAGDATPCGRCESCRRSARAWGSLGP